MGLINNCNNYGNRDLFDNDGNRELINNNLKYNNLKYKNCKGYFFSLDALLGLSILIIGLLLISNYYISTQPRVQVNYYSEDIISIFSETKVNELNNSYLKELIANGNITDMENSILEQIGIFWVLNRTDLAINLTRNISEELIPPKYGYSFVVGDDVIYTKPNTRNQELATYKSMITGIEKSRPIKGTAARIFLNQISSTMTTRYAFLGGFVGQGNISIFIEDIPVDANISEMFLEVDTGDDFDLYINSILCNNFLKGPGNMTSSAWDITYCNTSIINGIDNNFTFVFSGQINTSYIGGGFIKIKYLTKNIQLKNTSSQYYNFPGIDGLINLFDGFSVPGSLNNMEIYLHYLANHSNLSNNTFYVTIGNVTVFRDNYSNNTMSLTVNNTVLSSILNYTKISNQTVPLRVGFENLSYEEIITDKGEGDVITITDISGSMAWRFDNTNVGIERFCKESDLNNVDSSRLGVAKCILKTFSHNILYNITGNRVGLAAYQSSVTGSLPLTTNLTEITDEINILHAEGGTCTSCGVVSAANLLINNDMVDLLNKKWTFTNKNQTIDPINWYQISFDDSEWLTGYQNFGFGTGSDTYVGNVLFANLWDHSDDVPAPVDFTTGVNYSYNTFGFMSVVQLEELLSNSYFTGPSIVNWTTSGIINISDSYDIIFSDDFESNLGWTNGGTNEQWHYGTPLGRGGTSYGNPDPTFAHSGTRIWGEDCTNPTWNGDYRANANSRLTSPVIDCSNCTKTILKYYRWLNVEQPIYDQARISVRDNSGVWHVMWTNPTEMTESSWNLHELDISTYADNNPILQIRFGTQTDGGWEYSGWNIDDVEVISRDVNNNFFNLFDYWFIDSDVSSLGQLDQNFKSPTDSPINATLKLVHSINYSFFSGSATVYCNLTHPGGEETVWSEFWTGGSLPPEGPILEKIDITSKITSDNFIYNLKCGANLSGASPTYIAFDNISIELNWTNYGDDGWDWKQGIYGYTGYMNFYENSNEDLELTAQRVANDASGSYGIQIFITQEMIDVINSPDGDAWLSFDYRWDPRDDGSTTVFENTDQVWIKGYFESPLSGQHYLGSEMSNEDGDASPEIWTADDPDTENAGFYSNDISSWIDNGPGYYYLALGGKLSRNSDAEYGAFSFDNIQLAFTNTSGNTFYRNNFFISDTSRIHTPVNLLVTTNDGSDIYLNGNLLDSYNTADTNRAVPVAVGNFKNGDNILGIKLKNSDGTGLLKVAFETNITNRQKAMVIMSDGEANRCIGDYGTGTDSSCNQCGSRGCCPGSDGIIDDPCPSIAALNGCSNRYAKEQLVNLSCYYFRQKNISIYSVAFGNVVQCGKTALNLSALCDDGYTSTEPHYFESDNPSGIAKIYGQIANNLRIIFSVKKSQIISVVAGFEKSILYPDSYIFLNYTPIITPMVHGEIPLYFESADFNGCVYNLTIPSQIRPFEGNLLSYSGEHWIDFVGVNNSAGMNVAFNLSRFNTNYANLGDPFPIPIQGNYLKSGEVNKIIVNTGDNPYNSTNCSLNTTFLYTGLLNVINYSQPYSTVHPNATGCNWTIEHEMGYNFTLQVPDSYSGSANCFYTSSIHNLTGFDNDDSYNWAIYNFLKHLDYNSDGKVFINFISSDFFVDSRIIRDIPYLWGPTIAEVRIWQ